MAATTASPAESRTPLSRERVLRAAIDLADRDGIDALTMRNLAREVGAEAMSLYYHVANKEALLDGVVEYIVSDIAEEVARIDLPSAQGDWKAAMRATILTARRVMLRHPWAPGVIESRTTMSPATVLHFESLLGIMRQGGFSYDLAHHALHALGSRALGFTQELFKPDDVEEGDEAALEMLADMADRLPHLMGMMAEVAHDDPDSTLGWCDDQTEFEFGLDLLLDGLERLRATGGPA
jgi:AcrR family transcriptional regulator